MIHALPAREVWPTGRVVAIPVPCEAPVTRGSVDVCLSASPTGGALHPSLERALPVYDGTIPDLALYTHDLRRLRGPCYLVVRYAGAVIASGALRVVLP